MAQKHYTRNKYLKHKSKYPHLR